MMGFVHFFSRSRSPLSGRRRNLIINAPILIVSLIFIDIRQHLAGAHSAFIEIRLTRKTSAGGGCGKQMMAFQTTKGVTAATHTP
jgi:hypothetical protein